MLSTPDAEAATDLASIALGSWAEIDVVMRPLYESGASLEDLSKRFRKTISAIYQRASIKEWTRPAKARGKVVDVPAPPRPEGGAAKVDSRGVLARFECMDQQDRQKFNFAMRRVKSGMDEEACGALECTPNALSAFLIEHQSKIGKLLKCHGSSDVAAFLSEWHTELQAKAAA